MVGGRRQASEFSHHRASPLTVVASPAQPRSRHLHWPQESTAHEHHVCLVLLLFPQRLDGWGKAPLPVPYHFGVDPRMQPQRWNLTPCPFCPGPPVSGTVSRPYTVLPGRWTCPLLGPPHRSAFGQCRNRRDCYTLHPSELSAAPPAA